MNALNVNLTAEEIFRTNLVNLGNETKRRLIELLASSMSFVATDSKSNDKKLLNRIAGAWCDDVTTDEGIAVIRSARTQSITHSVRINRFRGIAKGVEKEVRNDDRLACLLEK